MSNKIKKRKKKKKSGVQTSRLPKKSASHFQNIAQIMQLASQHYRAGNLPQAEQLYRQILHSFPENVDALNSLGNTLLLSGRHDDAIACYRKLLSIKPQFAEIHANLGIALHESGKLDEAIASFEKTLAIKPDFAEAHFGLGNALQESGELDKAMANFEKALSIEPGYVEARFNLSIALKQAGRLEEAIGSFKKILSKKPNYGEVYRYLTGIKKHNEYDNEIQKMEELHAREELDAEDKMHLGFALGKVFEDLKQYDRSFRFISEANRLKRSSYMYSIQAAQDFFVRIKKVFSPEFFASQKDSGCQDETPIFIVGMPRSGTTLVEQILASHPLVFGAGELLDLTNLTDALCSGETTAQFPECILQFKAPDFSELGAAYIKKIRKHSKNAKHITDKLPHNFLRVGLIKVILPQAKIIHCRRDPMDNCLSIYKNYFPGKRSPQYAYDQNELGLYYNLYLELMGHWDSVLPGFMYSLKYEEMVADQQNQTEKLLEFCGLPWNDACLSFHKTKRRVHTVSFAQVRKPIYRDSVELWKRYEAQLAPLYKAIFGNSS